MMLKGPDRDEPTPDDILEVLVRLHGVLVGAPPVLHPSGLESFTRYAWGEYLRQRGPEPRAA